MRVGDVQGLLHDLKAYRSNWEEPATRAWLVEGAIPRLLAAGLRSLSMAPALVGGAKLAIAATDLDSLAESAPWPT